MSTIKSMLAEAAGLLETHSDSALLDAEVLLCLVLDKNRSYLRAWPDKPVDTEHSRRFWPLIQKRQQGIPIAYLTGVREFWSRDFTVTPDVLIPRPDTELLVELGLTLIPADKSVKVIDLGTGSGIIAITLAAERPHAHISAADASLPALNIARRNAQRHSINNITFYQSNWLAEIADTGFHLIISNPPYIAEDDCHLLQGDVRFEPKSALCAAGQGLGDIKTIADTARKHLEPGGHLLIEHGYDQQQQVQRIFKGFNYDNVDTYRDLSGQPRVTYGQWNTHFHS